MFTLRSLACVTVILILSLGVRSISELPSHFPRCHRSDPKMEECLINATEYVRPYIREGIPDFLPAIKEVIVPEITIDQRGSRAYSFLVHVRNLSIFGMDHYKFKRYTFIENPFSIYLDVDLPQLFIKGQYDLQGHLFFADMKGDGNIYANISNSRCICNFTLEGLNKNGIVYIHSKEITAKMHIGNITDYELTGLFKQSTELELVTNDIVKKNFHILVEEITPAIERVIVLFLKKIIGEAIEKIPYEKVYPK